MAVIDLDLNPDRRTLRNFGIAACVVLPALGAAGYFLWSFPLPLTVALAMMGMLSGLMSMTEAKWNLPLYRVLTVAFYPVGLVVSYVVLAVLFFGILTPVGLFFRLIGRDALRRRFEPGSSSYWIPRSDKPELRRYFRPF